MLKEKKPNPFKLYTQQKRFEIGKIKTVLDMQMLKAFRTSK